MPARIVELAGAIVHVFATPHDACRAAAEEVARAIRAANKSRGRATLGLATGQTPLPLYERLVAMHKDGDLSFTGTSAGGRGWLANPGGCASDRGLAGETPATRR